MASLTPAQTALLVVFGIFAVVLGGAAFHLHFYHRQNGERKTATVAAPTIRSAEDPESDIDWTKVPC